VENAVVRYSIEDSTDSVDHGQKTIKHIDLGTVQNVGIENRGTCENRGIGKEWKRKTKDHKTVGKSKSGVFG
jgi:hypothetical protein